MVRTEQGGSVLGFVIVSVVLAALLVGGVFMINRRDTPVPAPETTQPPAEEKPAETPAPPKENQPQPTPPSGQSTPTQLPSNGPVHEIPQTGPAETIMTALAIAFMSGAIVAFVRSKRHLASL